MLFRSVSKHSEKERDASLKSALDLIEAGSISLVINTPQGRGARRDGWLIRTAAVAKGVPCITTLPGFKAAIAGITALQNRAMTARSLQEWGRT